ncbi:MFS transporter [Chromatiaceae bacterium AAb-1]|nr:MFS transporter [Chromatiaceae bacterium AAb-1]
MRFPLPLLVLALSAFAIGTTEFVIMGLLTELSVDLQVDIPAAGWLVTGYALAVAIGAPFMAIVTSRLPRRKALLILMLVFILGNLLCAIAINYELLMLARVVTALCHGAFFGIGAVVASGLVPPHQRAQAVALMFMGLTLANVLGVPLGTALGQVAGWRSTFWAVTVIGVIAFAGLLRFLPANEQYGGQQAPLKQEIAAFKHIGIWLALLTTVFFAASMFALFTYIEPILRTVTGVSDTGVIWTLFMIGLGLTLGNLIGGKLADWRLGTSLALIFLAIAITSAVFSVSSAGVVTAEITLFLWAMAAFAAVPALQISVVTFGKDAPNLVSTMNISAFNAGNALGAWVGGAMIKQGMALTEVPLAAGGLALLGMLLTIITFTLIKPAAKTDIAAAA